jgi:hypothetical protein
VAEDAVDDVIVSDEIEDAYLASTGGGGPRVNFRDLAVE